MGERLPDQFEIVCSGRTGARLERHEEVVVYSRDIDLARSIVRTSRKSYDAGNDPAERFHRIDSTELRCTECGLIRRYADPDLTRLIGASCLRARTAAPDERRALLRQELRGIDAILRSIR